MTPTEALNKLTDEDLKRFAEACGYQIHYDLNDAPYWNDGHGVNLFDVFLHSKDVVIEALERFCAKPGFAWQLTKPDPDLTLSCSISKGNRCIASHYGADLNEAIIRAVLSANGYTGETK